MDWFFQPERLCMLTFLVLLEIALSVDNFTAMRESLVVFKEPRVTIIGTISSLVSLVLRVILLFCLLELTIVLDPIARHTFFSSGKGLFLGIGGAFLALRGVFGLKAHFSGDSKEGIKLEDRSIVSVLCRLAILDMVLSMDSVVASMSMVSNLNLIIAAMVIAHLILHSNWERIDEFFAQRKGMTTLTMSFISLLGVVSLIRGVGVKLAEEALLIALIFGFVLQMLNNGERLRHGAEKRAKSFRTVEGKISRSTEPTKEPAAKQAPFIRIDDYLEPDSLFASETCRNCNMDTERAFSFCLRCGTARVANAETFRREHLA